MAGTSHPAMAVLGHWPLHVPVHRNVLDVLSDRFRGQRAVLVRLMRRASCLDDDLSMVAS